MGKVLVFEKDESWGNSLSNGLSFMHQVKLCADGQDACTRLLREAYDAVILDLSSEDSGNAVLQTLKSSSPHTPFIVTSEEEKADIIVKVMKAGAADFIAKPYSEEKIRLALSQALESRSMKNEIDYLRRQQDIIYELDQIIAVSPAMKKVISDVKRFAIRDWKKLPFRHDSLQ
jgi:DNA-binding NtrC family response regulator